MCAILARNTFKKSSVGEISLTKMNIFSKLRMPQGALKNAHTLSKCPLEKERKKGFVYSPVTTVVVALEY